ncbi:MAG: branched-chain amino acid ABC transporter substrate-binding protein [Chryseobacterium sp.]|uniref:branched-chain amino acid ABC transporter substrate-binding protein n=1 Tax=Chryseobacterium sp. TaxID=1871047 RepID=UPI0025BBB225|nr:branched-chain amino acid ABC transporter substrate-binding protein [Chryseobacterium sp.]MCJ7935312.1 branched-chain amino acid ABC transporter substrate-binding protein [Chryseobacterium sp.]
MSWNFFDGVEMLLDGLSLLGSNSDTPKRRHGHSPKKEQGKGKYTEKVSAVCIAAATVLFIIVFKDPLPPEHYIQTLMVASLIGTAISFVLFFVLYVLGHYYFKNFFKLLLFSSSVILFSVSAVLYIYFKTGLFI